MHTFIPILGKLRQEGGKAKTNLSYSKSVVGLNNLEKVCFKIKRGGEYWGSS